MRVAALAMFVVMTCWLPSVALGSPVTLYVSHGGTIDKVAPDGSVTTFATGASAFEGLAVDASGNLYASYHAGANGEVAKFTPDGDQSTFVLGYNFPRGIAFDSAGNLCTANQYDGGSTRVYKYTPDGTGTFMGTTPSNGACAVAVDSHDNVYVSDIGGSAVYKFLPDSEYEWGTGNQDRSLFVTGPYLPYGLAFDAQDNLYVSELTNGRILKYDSDGVPLGVLASGLAQPAGLATDSLGNVYVATHGLGAVLPGVSMVAPDGTVTPIATLGSEAHFVVVAPEPATLSLLALGGLGALARRRRR